MLWVVPAIVSHDSRSRKQALIGRSRTRTRTPNANEHDPGTYVHAIRLNSLSASVLERESPALPY